MNGAAAGDRDRWEHLLRLAEGTAVNALVVDVKHESGIVQYDSGVQTARQIGAVHPRYEVGRIVDDMRTHGLRPIARLPAFQDSKFVRSFPHLGLGDRQTGGPWTTSHGDAWMDPRADEVRRYVIDLAVEVICAGFDEVQLDYVRFPTDSDPRRMKRLTRTDPGDRIRAIGSFVREARSAVKDEQGVLAVDVFGITASKNDEQGIGQHLEDLSSAADILCPMVYPSLYSPGWLGLAHPVEHPDVVVSEALDSAQKRVHGRAVIRPWLQAWRLSDRGIRQQTRAADSRGLGWMLWNSRSNHKAAWIE